MTLIALVTFLVMWLWFDETKPQHVQFEHGSGVFDSVKNYAQVFGDKLFLRYTLGMLLTNVVWMQIDHYIPIHFKEAMQETVLFGTTLTGAKMVSIIVFINTIMIVFLMTTINRLTKTMDLLKQYTLGAVMFAMGIFMTMTLNRFEWVIPMVVFYTLGEIIDMPASQVLRANMMNEDKIGSYSGFFVNGWTSGQHFGVVHGLAQLFYRRYRGAVGFHRGGC